MKPARLLLLSSALWLGCSDPTTAPAGDGGDKSDDVSEAAAALHCVVAHVVDDGVLEEGLVGAFAIDRMGILEGDSDGVTVDVTPAAGEARLGTHRFSKADGDTITAADADGRRTYRIETADEAFEVRVFSDSGLGVLVHDPKDGEPSHLATLDCRPGAAVPNDDDAEPFANCAGTRFESKHCRYFNGQFASPKCCKAACTVVGVDDPQLEESVGSFYDLDLDGVRGDEDAQSLRIDLTDPASTWRVGTNAFGPGDGDTLARQPSLESLYQRFLIDTADGAHFEIRIFDVSRLGVVLVKDAGAAEDHILSRLDCR